MARLRSPRPTLSPKVPVCSILAGWPTAPFGSAGLCVALDGAARRCWALELAEYGAAALPPGPAAAPAVENPGTVVAVIGVCAGVGRLCGERAPLSRGLLEGLVTNAPVVPATRRSTARHAAADRTRWRRAAASARRARRGERGVAGDVSSPAPGSSPGSPVESSL